MGKIKILPKYLGLLLLLCFTAVSCTKTGGAPDDGDDGPGGKKQAVFSLRMQMGSASPKTRDMNDADKVSGIRVVLYGKAEGRVSYCWDMDVSNVDYQGNIIPFHGYDVAEEPQMPTPTSFVSTAREVKRADYYLLVIINPTDKIRWATEKGVSAQEIERYTSGEPEIFMGMQGEILMTNHQGLVEVLNARDIFETELEAQTHPVPVQVERILAGVTVSMDNPTLPGNAAINGLMWNVDVVNQHTYWLRQLAEKATGEKERQGDADRVNFYAVDPNYAGFSANNATTEEEKERLNEELKRQFHYIITEDVEKYPVAEGGYAGEMAFLLENTMEAEEQRRDVTSRVVLTGNYYPNGPTDDDGHFFTYHGVWLTPGEIGGYAADPESIPQDKFPGLQHVIAKLQSASPPFDFMDIGAGEAFSVDGLNFYKNGRTYYSILIRHFDDVQKPLWMSYGRYGVVRNNVYQIEILSFAGPGHPVLPPVTTDPDDMDQWLTVRLKVVDWDEFNVDFDY